MKSCITCGMSFEGNHANDIGLQLPEGPVCKFDSENGKMKSAESVFENGVCFFAEAVANGDRDLAARITRKNMKSLPYWQAHPFVGLEGPVVTDQEFGQAMSKL